MHSMTHHGEFLTSIVCLALITSILQGQSVDINNDGSPSNMSIVLTEHIRITPLYLTSSPMNGNTGIIGQAQYNVIAKTGSLQYKHVLFGTNTILQRTAGAPVRMFPDVLGAEKGKTYYHTKFLFTKQKNAWLYPVVGAVAGFALGAIWYPSHTDQGGLYTPQSRWIDAFFMGFGGFLAGAIVVIII